MAGFYLRKRKSMKNMKIYVPLLTATLMSLLAMGCTQGKDEKKRTLDLELTFEVSEVTETTAKIDITPSKGDIGYYWSVIPKRIYDEFGGLEALKSANMDDFRSLAEAGSVSVETIITQNTSLGGVSETVADLDPGTEYVVYGYAITSGGESGKVSQSNFATEEGTVDEAHLKIALGEPGMTRVPVTYTPDNMDIAYFTDHITDEVYQTWGGTSQGLLNYFNYRLEDAAATQGITTKEYLERTWRHGAFNKTYDYLEPETGYWFYAVELSLEGEVIGLRSASATTTERVMADVTFDLDVSNIGQTNVDIKIIPNDKDQPYYWDFFPKSDYDGIGGGTDESFMTGIVNRFGSEMEYIIDTGDIELEDLYGFNPDTEYMLVVFAWDETWVSELYMEEFTTTGVIDPADTEIDIQIQEVTSTMMASFIFPNDRLVPIHFQVMTKEFADAYATDKEKVQAGFDQYIQVQMDRYPGEFTREEVIQMRRAWAKDKYTFVEPILVPDTEYYIWAGAFSSTGQLLSKPFLVPFRTEVYEESAATVEFTINKYFRYRNAIIDPVPPGETDPKLGEDIIYTLFEGIETSGTDKWYVGWFRGDRTDLTQYPNYYIATQLYTYGEDNWLENGQPRVWPLGVNPYDTWTLCAVAIGADGKYGVPWRKVLHITPEGGSPASEYPAGVY